jgi:hypothetical protein
VLDSTLRFNHQFTALKAANFGQSLAYVVGNEEAKAPNSFARHDRMHVSMRTAKDHLVIRERQTWPTTAR